MILKKMQCINNMKSESKKTETETERKVKPMLKLRRFFKIQCANYIKTESRML